MFPPFLLEGTCLVLGLIVGSFLNVVIARVPDGRSIVHPPSACPACGTPIRWHDNIPVLSWLGLRGRCRACHGPISWRYPAVELLTGLLFVLAASHAGSIVELLSALLFLAALVAISGSLLGNPKGWLDTLIGVAIGGGIFVVIIVASGGGMGGGDMKLGAMMGAFLGWKLVLLAILLGVLGGGLVAIALLAAGRKGRKDAVPFGPFLALGGAVSLLWGKPILDWYLGRFIG